LFRKKDHDLEQGCPSSVHRRIDIIRKDPSVDRTCVYIYIENKD